MKTHLSSWLPLVPHILASAFFVAAFAWMSIVQTNRSDPDLYLAIGGFVALAVALLSSVAVVIRIIVRPQARRGWPWLLVHAAGLTVSTALASAWIGGHLA